MNKTILSLCLPLFLALSCMESEDSQLASFDVFCEMVSSGAKPFALSHPMDISELKILWKDMNTIALRYGVEIEVENDLVQTTLFPSELTQGTSVVLISSGLGLKQYAQLKAEVNLADTTNTKQAEAFARRFGRLLGYDTHGINKLLSKSSGYRTLKSFGVLRQTTHLYYRNLPTAQEFYIHTLGLSTSDSLRFQISQDAFIELHAHDEKHPQDQAKSTAIALLTDQLPQWYAWIQDRNVPIKYPYKPKDGGAHDGFVAVDPGGYLLEFETFKQHPENERFMSVLGDAPRIASRVGELNFFGSITWTYHKDVLKMQRFYEEILGFPLVADQGWTKIYRTAPNSFVGLVDECRGMEDYAENKAVELDWQVSDLNGLYDYGTTHWKPYLFDNSNLRGPENYTYRLKGVMPTP